MKKLIRAVPVLLFALACTISCSKEDDVNLGQITGKWAYKNDDPHMADVPVLIYTFNDDGTCTTYTAGFGVDPETVHGTYQISVSGKPRVLTIYTEEGKSREQYYIHRLDSKRMRLENTDSDVSPQVLNFTRVEE